MAVKGDTTYKPASVAKGLRDLIAWETRHRPSVDIFDMGGGVYEARVTLAASAVKDAVTLEHTIRELLPAGYTLKLNLT